MSFLSSQAAPSFTAELGQQGESEHGVLAGLALMALAACVWALEARRRAGPWTHAADGASEGLAAAEPGLLGIRAVLHSPWQLCKSLVPEACVLAFVLVVAATLLAWSASAGPPPVESEEDKQLWEQIRSQWPYLGTADSLLGLRAMLRMVLLFSAVLRTEEAVASPLAGEPGILLLLAAVARVALLAFSPQDVYHLDGPLGGIINMAVEVLSLGPLAFLAFGKYFDECRGPSWQRMSAVAAAALFAWHAACGNHLALGGPGEELLDVLFSWAEALELAAAVAFLIRVLALAAHGQQQLRQQCGAAFAAFAHAMLPVQQLLSAYFLLTAWGGAPLEEMPALVGAGRPFELLQIGGAAQVGAYAVAGAAQLVLAGVAEKDHQEAAPVQV